ncbi:hypothetical protein E4U42_005188 [Claviceps africana]|uniref:TEL2-interacting protein 1 n=1 Tax=Claviceps africana TaxID=83212 RepID=A0A8K0J433_9HYPO|nr:hypothetical protein E4U42_005188 [Claviceps africana]
METEQASAERNDLFQKLKPCCVRMSQLAIRETNSPNAPRELQDLTSQIFDILHQQVRRNPLAFDEKLAEYVFFPLFHVFRQVGQYPARLAENCIKCLQMLIEHGWKSKIAPQMVQQIFSLLVFIIDGVPGSDKNNRHVPEELQLEAFRALLSLIRVASPSAMAMSGLTQGESMLVLGHGITVMLDGASAGPSPEIQAAALDVLQLLYASLRDHAALANFLPGTISSMARLLSAPGRHKAFILSKGLAVVQTVLVKVLGDLRTTSILHKSDAEQSLDPKEAGQAKVLTPPWLAATSAQVKLALSSMMKLRTHDSQKVRDALERLCISVLDECHSSLSNCTNILVETAVVLDTGGGGMDSPTDTATVATQINLRYLISIYPDLGDTVKTAVYSWLSNLPRIMQSADEDVKKISVHNLGKGLELMQSLMVESSTLEESLGDALRDSIVSLMQSSKQPQQTSYLQLLDGSQHDKAQLSSSPEQTFAPVLMTGTSQQMLRQEVIGLVNRIGSSSLKASLATSMMEHVRESTSADRIASFWLCHELVKAVRASNADLDTFLDLSALPDLSDDMELISEDLYSYSVQVLESHVDSDPADWQLEAMALEVVAYSARGRGIVFRQHLIDVLFPVVTFLGSDSQLLQQHAIASLNSIALSCGYASVSDLIVDNVDYMVNSVSLRLNSLDVSPASMQVLMMMIRLSGPGLIPYLNDVVESVFAALENYHGYTLLAENLFSVLKEIVDQASRNNERLLASHEQTKHDHKKRAAPVAGLDDLMEELDRREARRLRDEAEEAALKAAMSQGHPKRPWKADTLPREGGEEDDDDEQRPPSPLPPEPEKPANSPTYQLIRRITLLTQHYLTSPTPKLRRSLLELLATASPILAGDEDGFLPVVNAIWPVVIERLRDAEPFIGIEACHALSSLCEAAGDFLSSRFRTEWPDWLRDWCLKVKKQAEHGPRRHASQAPRASKGASFPAEQSTSTQPILIPLRSADGSSLTGKVMAGEWDSSSFAPPSSSSPSFPARTTASLGQHASPVKMWNAVVRLLTAVVSYVRVDDVMFDDMVDLLIDVLEEKDEVRDALEVINADAVWLARYEKGRVEILPTPVMEGGKFADM